MKLYTWLKLQVIKQQLMRGNLFVFFYGKTRDCSLYDDYMEVRLGNKRKEFKIYYKDTNYNRKEMSDSFRADYMIKHWLTNKRVRRTVYIATAESYAGKLKVETSYPDIYKIFSTQSDATSYNGMKEIVYKDYKLDCSGGYRSVGYSNEKRTFKNIVEYNAYEKITYKESEN